MLRSLFTGISGLSVHQTMLDVTSNNIANVNTTGFKSASTRFEDTFSQLVKSGAAPRLNERGGMNPAQVGLGVKLQSITNNFTGGAAQNTGRNLDTMINGDGFFVLKKTNGTQVYTRNGSFGMDAQGQVVAADGSFVQGWMADDKGIISASGATRNVVLPLTKTFGANPTTEIKYAGNLPADKTLLDPAGKKTAENMFVKTQTLTVYDDKGNPHNLLMKFSRPDYDNPEVTPKWKVELYDADAYKTLPKDKRDGEFKAGDNIEGARYKITPRVKDGSAGTAADSVEFTFEKDGSLSKDTREILKSITFRVLQSSVTDEKKVNVKDGVAGKDISIDLSSLTGFAGVNTAEYDTIDGNAAGNLTGFGVEADGTIRGVFSNGDSRALAKIATASFKNPLGLEKAGASYFVESGNSGQPQIGEPGSGTRGAMTGGAIEMSNVDLAAEFTNLILSQRGFQANTRVITTSDEILQELVSMKR